MHWSPVWLADSGPSPKAREEGPLERGEKVSELREIHREFLNPSMTPDASPAQSDSLVSQGKTDWDPRALLFWLPTHTEVLLEV